MTRAQKILLGSLCGAVVGLWLVLWFWVINPPAPMAFGRVELLTTAARPGSILTMRATVSSRVDPECLLGTLRLLRFGHDDETRVQGTRQAQGNGHQVVVYTATVPQNAPAGHATFKVREMFMCGAGGAVESPALSFTVER